MTHPHPLTDDTCFGIALETKSRIGYQPPSTFDYMRAAYDKGADWQLEQVIKYLENDLKFVLWTDDFMDKFKKAMRPQQQEDN